MALVLTVLNSATLASLMEMVGGEALTVVRAVTVLLAKLASAWFPFTLAELVITPTTGGLTVMLTVAAAPSPKLPRLQETISLLRAQLPCEETEETKLTPGGRVLVSTTPVALAGPL